MRTTILTTFTLVLLTGCLFTGNDEINSKHLIKDFYLQSLYSSQNRTLIQHTPDAQTDGIIIEASVKAVDFDKDFIIATQNVLDNNSGTQTRRFHILDIRGYNASNWNKADKVYSLKTSEEFITKRKQLGVSDSLNLNITSTNGQP
jgi:hypothetical protein